MSKWEGADPSNWENKDYEATFIASRDWLPLSDAIRELSLNVDIPDARRWVVEQARKGLIHSYAERVRRETANFDCPFISRELSDFEQFVERTRLNYGGDVKVYDDVLIPTKFWRNQLLNSEGDWVGAIQPFESADRANWSRNDFETIEFSILLPPDVVDEEEQLVHRTIVGVYVELSQIQRLLPPKVPNVSEVEVSTQYDWLGVFAHVASVFHYDGGIENPNLRGSQAKIEDLMANWFRDRGDAIPSPSSLKPKAKLILSALRQKASRS